jgi:GTP cyclohydrolase I
MEIGVSQIDIDKVGVSDVCYPIEVLDKKAQKQATIACINMYVDLPHHFRGTHMSRFIEVLNKHRGEITVRNIGEILQEISYSLEAKTAHMELAFKYFIEKAAPVSGAKSLMGYECRFIAAHDQEGTDDFVLEVKVPVMNLCPCSKEISDTAAHNQRSEVTAQIRSRPVETMEDIVWIEDIVDIVEASASCDLYSLLKRTDEKYVSERAYDNPRFVEDIVRIIADKLIKNNKITWFSVRSKNYESIHNHNAYAYIEKDKLREVHRSWPHIPVRG